MNYLHFILGQGVSLQFSVTKSSPMHAGPPCCGGGSLHVRALVLVEGPHVFVHGDQTVHIDHIPFTKLM